MSEIGTYLLELDTWTGASVETKRFAGTSISTKPSDTPASVLYDGRIIDAGIHDISLTLSGIAIGRAGINPATIILDNGDGGLDPFSGYAVDGRAARLKWLGDPRSPVATATLLARLTMRGIDGSEALKHLRFKAADRLIELKKPLLSTRYAGTTITNGATAEGNVDLKDQLKPYTFGAAPNVPCKLVNQFNLLYQVSNAPVSSIAVKDGLVPLTSTSDHPNLTQLIAATLVPGQYATCLTLGIFRLGGSPAFMVTADVVEGPAASDRSAARIVQRMLSLYGWSSSDIDTDSFDAAHTFNPAEVNFYIDSDTQALDAIGRVLDSIGSFLIPSTEGVLQIVTVGTPSSTAAATYELRDIGDKNGSSFAILPASSEDGDGVPAWSIVLNWGPIWQKMSSGDIAGVVSDATKALYINGNSPLTVQASSIKTAHPLAPEITFDTLFTYRDDVQAEATRRLAMYGVRRDRPVITITFLSGQSHNLGDTVAVQMNRLGYSAGRNFVIVGRSNDYQNRTIKLTLWG